MLQDSQNPLKKLPDLLKDARVGESISVNVPGTIKVKLTRTEDFFLLEASTDSPEGEDILQDLEQQLDAIQ